MDPSTGLPRLSWVFAPRPARAPRPELARARDHGGAPVELRDHLVALRLRDALEGDGRVGAEIGPLLLELDGAASERGELLLERELNLRALLDRLEQRVG